MSVAPWRSALENALNFSHSLPESRYFQLATVTPEGNPANRTVVFRGFCQDSDNLQVVTDARSEKVFHLQQTPKAEICWYFSQSREQFRLSGHISLITAEMSQFSTVRNQVWEQLSYQTRLQFFWPYPKRKRSKPETAFNSPPPAMETPPETFVVIIFSPYQVDHLQLKGNPQNRYLYWLEESGNWEWIEVNP